MKIAVTGVRGFVGRHLTTLLMGRKHDVVPLGRSDWDLTSGTSPAPLISGCDAVVHLAALVHNRGRDDDQAFVRTMFDTNVRGTERLARAAVECGVRRFVFLSSAAVYGRPDASRAFDESSACHPETAYGRSKLAAEEALQAIATETGLAVVALRPPLVYGAGVPGSFRTLVRLAWRGWPVPSGVLSTRRSLIAVTNLCDLIGRALETASPLRGAYVAAEVARPLGDLYYGLCEAAGRRPLVVPFPKSVLRLALDTIGRAHIARAVLDDFVMDAAAARTELTWAPRDLFIGELYRAMAAEAGS